MADTAQQVRSLMAALNNLHVLATVDGEGRPHCRWMGALVEDPQTPWTFYLACGKTSRKMAQIAANPNAQLVFSDQAKWVVATLSGTAEADTRQAPRQWLFDKVPAMKDYFSSPTDPGLAIIRFRTRTVELLSMQAGHEPARLDLA